jgi:CBS domain-containing protein
MTTFDSTRLTPPLMLHDRTAAELMTPNPKSVRQSATVAEAATFLSLRGISAAPVIDEAGRPVGVVSRTDLLNHRGQRAAYLLGLPGQIGDGSGPAPSADEAVVRDVMTPAGFFVGPDAAAAKVVEKMIGLNVRRVFVVDDEGVLIGVISAFDVLRCLGRPCAPAG